MYGVHFMDTHEGFARPRTGARSGPFVLGSALAALVLSPAIVSAKDAVPNLGGGLDQIAGESTSTFATQRSLARGVAQPQLIRPIQFDDAGRALVRISFDGKVPAAALLDSLKNLDSVDIKASDMTYRAGVIEAYVPTSALTRIATTKGVRAV